MRQYLLGLFVVVVLFWSSSQAIATHMEVPKHTVGTLACKVLPHSGLNLLVHSSRDIRCIFTSSDKHITEHYKGETGIKFGVDIALSKREDVVYAVLARQFKVGSYQLAGKYSGASGNARMGLTVGGSAPIEKSDKSISLQPVQVRGNGAGAATGFVYMYLEIDGKP